jgi:hypothetical protein
MKNLTSLMFIITIASFNVSAFGGGLVASGPSKNLIAFAEMADNSASIVKWQGSTTTTLTSSKIMEHAATLKVLAAATDEYLLYDGTSVTNTMSGNIYSAHDAQTYMSGILKDSETLFMKDGSKINLDQFLNNNGNQNIIDWNGLDRLKDGLIDIDKAVMGPGGLGGS